MNHLLIYESFISNTISKVSKYLKYKLGNEQSQRFISGLRFILNKYDFPIDKISDDDIKYLPSNAALKINKGNNEIFNNYGIFCIKFWFSLEKGYLGFTGVGDKEYKFVDEDGMSETMYEYITKILGIKTGKLNRIHSDEYSSLNHGDDVVLFAGEGEFNIGSGKMTKAKIYKNELNLYAIQNVASGSSPDNVLDWREWGRFSWSLGAISNPNDDHSYLYKYTTGNDKLVVDDYNVVDDSPLRFNLPINNGGELTSWHSYYSSIRGYDSIKNSDFSIVIYLDKMMNPDTASFYETPSNISRERKKSRKDSLKLTKDVDIKKANIDRYLSKILNKHGINEKSLDLKNLQKFISNSICGDYSYFIIERNININYIREFITIIKNMMDVIDSNSDGNIAINNYNRILKFYIDLNRLSISYKNKYDSNYNRLLKLLNKNLNENDVTKLVKEYIETSKNIGSYINDYVKKQEINTIDDYLILLNKIISINNITKETWFRPKNRLIRIILEDMKDEIYISNIDGSKDEIIEDIKNLNNIFKYIKSILN